MASKWTEWVEQHLDVHTYSGDEAMCRCVFHTDRSPSMAVNVKKGVYHCYSCGASGRIESIGHRLSITMSSKTNLDDLTLAIQQLRSVKTETVRVYTEQWLDRFDQPHPYLRKRGFNSQVRLAFRLGYEDETNSVTIPIRDLRGQVLGVIRRRLDKDAKPRYVYPRGFRISQHLFAAHLRRRRCPHTIAITEGTLDTVAMWGARIPSVAIYGSKLSDKQAQTLVRLNPRRVVIMTDADDAGRKAADNITSKLSGIVIKVPEYTTERTFYDAGTKKWRAPKDPAELTIDQRCEMFDQ